MQQRVFSIYKPLIAHGHAVAVDLRFFSAGGLLSQPVLPQDKK